MKSFLDIPHERWVAHNQLAFAIRDSYPVTLGHTLVITRELVPTWFEATREQQLAVLELVDVVKVQLDREYSPNGYNVGFNAGEAAGQTVPHLHVHVIPRYDGDQDDPRGGVRHVIPPRGNYKRIAADWLRPPGPGGVGRASAARRLLDGEPGRELKRALAPLFERADEAVIIASFIKRSGVDELENVFDRFLARGGSLRIITGDYLEITQADALRLLLDRHWSTQAFREPDEDNTPDTDEEAEDAVPVRGRFELRVVKHEDIGRAFHPKAYLLWGEDPADGVAYVGSSNLSRSALVEGVEWNLRIERRHDPAGFDEVRAAAEALWRQAAIIDENWLADYRARSRAHEPEPRSARTVDDDEAGERDEDNEAPEPRGVQTEAIAELVASRDAGHVRALVVMATGLGKTFLAAFDVQKFADLQERPIRVLIVAHRRELLTQAERTFRLVFPSARFSWCVGASSDLGGDFVLASIQKLVRLDLARLPPDQFDYVIIDEVHHSAAPSYRVLLDHLRPRFLLGLTATPERADEGDVAGLFNDNVVFRADLGRGISEGELVPFAYEGLKDPVDYTPIPWRNGKFEPEALAAAVQTQARMMTLWEAWQRLPGSRSLVFCVTISHAQFVTAWLAEHGVRVVCVHSGPDSHDRLDALRKLEAGDIDAITTVDLFNEGIDCKPIDRVVMLRPTASPVVFLQQLGRGLRTVAGKQQLQVVDFVGNHHAFLNRIRLLLSLSGDRPGDVHQFIRTRGQAPVELPQGCSVHVELEAIDLLAKLIPSSSDNELIRVYRELRASRGRRPNAGELFRRGLNPASVRKAGVKTWFEFVDSEGDLSEVERALLQGAKTHAWLADLEQASLTKSFKMVVLESLLARGALGEGMALDELATLGHAYLVETPALYRDIKGVQAVPQVKELVTDEDRKQWLSYWRKNPISALTTSDAGKRAWFEVEGERLVSRVPVPDTEPARDALLAMTHELVDWQLARYRKRIDSEAKFAASGEIATFRMKVIGTSSGTPILHFGTQPRERLPHGETEVRLKDGSLWQFKFVKIACNVARPVASSRNALPDLLREWFGPEAGKPGTDLHVEFRRAPEGWWVEPVGAKVIVLTRRDQVVAYPSLRAAAGAVVSEAAYQGDAVEAKAVRLPIGRVGDELFVVRAAGDSMLGGATPIRDGDWVVFEWARQRGLAAVIGRIALVGIGDPNEDRQWLIKRLVRTDDGLRLRSENPAHADLEVGSETEVVAVFRDVVRPEQLAPAPGTWIPDAELAAVFAVSEPPAAGISRIDGHLFLLVDKPQLIVGVDRIGVVVPDREPSETAFVLTRGEGGWRYAGVGRWLESERLWAIPAVDSATSE